MGSGDREKPITGYTAATAVTNYFFMFKDKPDDTSYPGTTDCGIAVVCLNSLLKIEAGRGVALEPGNQEGLVPGSSFNRAGRDPTPDHIQRRHLQHS
ncbi:hypothetical protein LP415_16810 [Polaromonas sp. P1(28)-8]|nr:hypothetical protein LP415_16810 [Polaromonas sp. P1(28)-8]